MQTIRVTDEATRPEIAEAIAELKARHDRLPVHYEDARAELMGDIDELVDDWLAAES